MERVLKATISFVLCSFIFFSCDLSSEKPGNVKDNNIENPSPIVEKITKVEPEIEDTIPLHGFDTCYVQYKKLSHQYQFNVTKFSPVVPAEGCSALCLYILRKKQKDTVQQISISSVGLLLEKFEKHQDSRSYITGYGQKTQVVDNDFGDLVVADFNFDGKEDLAFIVSLLSNGGPWYRYFLQNDQGLFSEDHYLSDTMTFFPSEINQKEHTLINYVHASAYGVNRNTYHYDKVAKKWSLKGSVYIGD